MPAYLVSFTVDTPISICGYAAPDYSQTPKTFLNELKFPDETIFVHCYDDISTYKEKPVIKGLRIDATVPSPDICM